ncbi:MAG: L,D-transpeptidase [Parcubacteria group bacterium]|nr:L,D-transpeptidase [Parcubacteria group bacterium]
MKQALKTPIPFWAVLLTLCIMGAGMLVLFIFFRQTVFNYALSLPKAGEISNALFNYGEQPSLSDPDFFKKTKDEFVAQKANFIEADLSQMKLRLYAEGVLAKEVPILTKGKEGSWWETPAGIYKIGSKEKNHFSSFGHVYQPWSMTFQGNFFIHGWPYYPDGSPVASTYSGGCIRLADEDAQSIFELANVGMPVLVFEKDFASDEFSYRTRTPDVTANAYFAADVKNNFVFLEQSSKDTSAFGGFSQLLGSLVATDYINIEKKIILTEEMVSGANETRLIIGEEVTPYDLLYLGLVGTSTAPTHIFAKILGAKRFGVLFDDKARAVGMSHTKDGATTPEDLFYLAKYIYHNRNFIFKMSAGDLKNSAYGESQFKDVPNGNLFADDPSFIGGKMMISDDGAESFMGVFNMEMGGETRPIFIFLGGSASVTEDMPGMIQYIRSSYR